MIGIVTETRLRVLLMKYGPDSRKEVELIALPSKKAVLVLYVEL
jgi:hypothetical protein